MSNSLSCWETLILLLHIVIFVWVLTWWNYLLYCCFDHYLRVEFRTKFQLKHKYNRSIFFKYLIRNWYKYARRRVVIIKYCLLTSRLTVIRINTVINNLIGYLQNMNLSNLLYHPSFSFLICMQQFHHHRRKHYWTQ